LKILVVTNFYPPHYVGGYELGCRDVVEGLRGRGHQVVVLTSTYGVDKPQAEDGVYRWLSTDFVIQDREPAADLQGVLKKERQNRRALKRVCRAFTPDLIYHWNLKHISVSTALQAQRMGYPTAYFVSDSWLSEWRNDAWYAQRQRRPKRLHRRLLWHGLQLFFKSAGLMSNQSLDLSQVQFASHYLRRASGAAGELIDAEVIHWGVNSQTFAYRQEPGNPSRLLYVGQLIASKGIRTAVETLALLRREPGLQEVTLTVAGGPDYDNQIQRLVASMGLDDRVTFLGLLPREQLPEVYRQHGILLFPSVWNEPFSITLLEAMASGAAIVGTQTGGSAEILEDGVNSLLFEKEDAEACARQILRLLKDSDLYDRLRQQARRTIEQSYRLEHMVDRIERSLQRRLQGCGRKTASLGTLAASTPLENSCGAAGEL
jgi:glycogen synthase